MVLKLKWPYNGLLLQICDVVSELARNHIDDDGVNQWPEFLQFMFNCANAQDPNIKEAGIRMFT